MPSCKLPSPLILLLTNRRPSPALPEHCSPRRGIFTTLESRSRYCSISSVAFCNSVIDLHSAGEEISERRTLHECKTYGDPQFVLKPEILEDAELEQNHPPASMPAMSTEDARARDSHGVYKASPTEAVRIIPTARPTATPIALSNTTAAQVAAASVTTVDPILNRTRSELLLNVLR